MSSNTGAIISGMHIFDGVLNNRTGDVLKAWDQGCLELSMHLAQYAVECNRLFNESFEAYGGGPGVFDYEVSYEFGAWFGDMLIANPDETPHGSTCRNKICELNKKFWSHVIKQEAPMSGKDLLERLVKGIDGPMFAEQRRTLGRIIENCVGGPTKEHLIGLESLLDQLADIANDVYGVQCLLTEDEELSDEEKWPIEDWKRGVANGDTCLGYQEWIEHNKEGEAAGCY